MGDGYLILFGLGLGLLAFLLWMLFPIGDRQVKKEKPKGYCPVCAHPLNKGEKIRSDVVEIGNHEVQTKIKGCPYCMGVLGKQKRGCPVCKKKLPMKEHILAISDPRVDKHKLAIRGCRKCYPGGFLSEK